MNQLPPHHFNLVDEPLKRETVLWLFEEKGSTVLVKQRRSAVQADGKQQERLPVAFHSESEQN